MKLTIIISIVLTLCSRQSYADENYIVNDIHNSGPYRYLTTNHSPINQLLLVRDLTINSIDSLQFIELPNHISGKFKNELLSIKAGVIQSNEASNWSKFYFQSALTLHQYDRFNLTLMANLEQFNSFYSQYSMNDSAEVPYAKSPTINNAIELNYSYGLMGSYSINSTWKFSGGIIHTQTLNEDNSNTSHTNKSMALIGTTYSF